MGEEGVGQRFIPGCWLGLPFLMDGLVFFCSSHVSVWEMCAIKER